MSGAIALFSGTPRGDPEPVRVPEIRLSDVEIRLAALVLISIGAAVAVLAQPRLAGEPWLRV